MAEEVARVLVDAERTRLLELLLAVAAAEQAVAELVPHDEWSALSLVEAHVTIDLAALRQREGRDTELLSRYVRAIEVDRGDYNGRVLTIRRSDLIELASILQRSPDDVSAHLDDLGLRYHL